jgi:hypothetical protein
MVNPRCSIASADTSLVATAPHVMAWLAIEYPGAWDAKAVNTAPLPGLSQLREVVEGHGIRILLIRRDRVNRAERTILVATPMGTCAGSVQDLHELLAWDWPSIAQGHLPGFGVVTSQTTLICTNGKRDQCCAIEGRALIDRFGAREHVWECTHIGGHRFAPVVLDLPSGLLFGRMTPADMLDLFSGRAPVNRLRGSSFHHPAAQAADVAHRTVTGDPSCTTNPVELTAIDDHTVVVRVDPVRGETRDYTVVLQDIDPQRQSCGAELVPARQWLVIG